jgi:hypothetical protein
MGVPHFVMCQFYYQLTVELWFLLYQYVVAMLIHLEVYVVVVSSLSEHLSMLSEAPMSVWFIG